MTKENESILIDKCKKGDINAFEELISGYEKKVFNIVYRITGDYNDAEDISQDVFIKVFKAIKNFKEQASFYTWLYRITINECMDKIKKKKKAIVYSLDVPIETEGDEITREVKDERELPDEKIERKELRSYIQAALNSISYEHRTMIILRDIQGFSYEEIAEMLKCPGGTVKSRISRARKVLKDLLNSKRELFFNSKV